MFSGFRTFLPVPSGPQSGNKSPRIRITPARRTGQDRHGVVTEASHRRYIHPLGNSHNIWWEHSMAFSDNDLGPRLFPRPLSMMRQRLGEAVHAALPDGAHEEEFTEALLFLLSIRLNRLTGGVDDMTFSARSHLAAQDAPLRLLWTGIVRVIDLYCACFRGEVRHCETAWMNHNRRRPTRRR